MSSDLDEFMRQHDSMHDTNVEHYPYSLPQAALRFSVRRGFFKPAALRKAIVDSGSHFFDQDTMEFFNSQLEDELIDDRFFITSEQLEEGDPRFYRVRWVYQSPKLDHLTVGDLDTRFPSLAEARQAAETLVRLIRKL